MYKCLNCGHLFEEGEQLVSIESIGECHGMKVYEKNQMCPICSGDFEEANCCLICEELFIGEDDYCEDCKKSVVEKFSKILKNNFTTHEIELLDEIFDGKSLIE